VLLVLLQEQHNLQTTVTASPGTVTDSYSFNNWDTSAIR
jgi:hypothetical protein